jgi:hypothetical protein
VCARSRLAGLHTFSVLDEDATIVTMFTEAVSKIAQSGAMRLRRPFGATDRFNDDRAGEARGKAGTCLSLSGEGEGTW